MNTYYVDARNFSIDKFRDILKQKDLLPGRIALKEGLDERFDLMKSNEIHSLHDLVERLKNKAKIENFARATGLDISYLTLLRREANSYLAVPVKLNQLPFDDRDLIARLNRRGIRNSEQLFAKAYQRNSREELARLLQSPDNRLLELVQLCDLVRITGVGPVFARIIYDSGIRSAREFLSIDATDLLDRLSKTNSEKGWTKAKFTVKDIEYCKDLGKELPLVLE